MEITWKDTVATFFAAAVLIFSYAKLQGADMVAFASWRMATLAVFASAFAVCIMAGSNISPVKNRWMTTAAVLGAIAFGAGIVGLIVASKLLFIVLTVDVLVLWAGATGHHLLNSERKLSRRHV